MAFDPLGTLTRTRYFAPTIIGPKSVRISWNGPPAVIPATWCTNPNSRYEAWALQALLASSLALKYNYYLNVPLAELFRVDVREFLKTFRSNPHWTGQSKLIRKNALFAIRQQIGNKAVDFLICNKAGKIVAGLEVDGPHHRGHQQKMWDFSKSMLFGSKGLPLLRVSTASMNPLVGGGQHAHFSPLLAKAKINWDIFNANPSLTTLQLHNP